MPRQAFSLIELLVVLSIIALVSSGSYSTYRRWHRSAVVRQSAEQVADLMRTALERSVGEQQIYGVLFDAANRQVSLISYGDSFNPSATYTTIDRRTLDERTRLVDVTFVDASSGAMVRYTAAGAPSTTGSAGVESVAGDSYWRVTQNPSGSVQVSEVSE